MVRHNNMINNNHFHKNWQGYVKTWFSQPFDKIKRRRGREKKALKVAPRPVKGPLRPVVQCPSIRYNRKSRLGHGFTLQELKAAKINKYFAKSIGIAVDYRRRNKSYESIQKNKQRIDTYTNKIILFPKNENKLKPFESSKENCKLAVQLKGIVMGITPAKKHIKSLNVDKLRYAPSVYKILKDARNAVKKHRKKSKKLNASKFVEDEK